MREKWVVWGDFNSVLFDSEKTTGGKGRRKTGGLEGTTKGMCIKRSVFSRENLQVPEVAALETQQVSLF